MKNKKTAKKFDVMDLLWKYVITESNMEKALEYLKELIFKNKPETSKAKGAPTISKFNLGNKIVEIHYTDDKIMSVFIHFV